jgi:hypothetical protein
LSTAYHPQTDGQTKRINQVIEWYLHTFTSRRQDNWDDLMPSGEFHYNNSKHSLTQQTPFMLNTGRNPHMGFEPQQPRSNLELVNEFAEHMALGIEEAKAALTKAKDEYAMYYNCRREPACKETSIRFLISYTLSHSPPVHMYSPSSPLYYSQGL